MQSDPYIVKSRKRRKCGSECSFYKIGKRGLKCYPLKCDAVFAFKAQKRLSNKGLAPQVFCNDVFKAEWGPKNWRCKGWAYWTQIADTKIDYSRHGVMYNELAGKLRLLGYCGDYHSENVGLVKILGKKELVLIDTGPFCKEGRGKISCG